ncbi:MAG: hypothetical protein M0O93_06765 [Bacteroidales bacterium]|nr:hypothetical protein [Bacteroidales bacterium]
MKKINKLKPEVYLSFYDNSPILYLVDKKYKDIENICVAVKFGDIVIKISSKDLCECDFNEAIEKHSEELMSPIFWQIIGVVQDEVTKALEMLGHSELGFIWTDSKYNSYGAWYYYGYGGLVYYLNKDTSISVRPAQAFQL